MTASKARAAARVDHGPKLSPLPDGPPLARAVPRLPPETLHQLIRVRGLDACGELLAAATPAQLTAIADLDLWRGARHGSAPQFDVQRFGEWIEALVAAGEALAARTVSALDPEVVVAGLTRHIRVFDPGIFEPTAQTDDERPALHEAMREGDLIHASDADGREAGADGLACEVGGYLVRARRTDAWEAIVVLLVALDTDESACFHDLMRTCRRLSNSRSEVDGLDDLLPPPEQQLHEVVLAREQRQTAQGYATPGDARAYLQMARTMDRFTPGRTTPRSTGRHPIVAAYFRATDDASTSADPVPEASSSLAAEQGAPTDATGVPVDPPSAASALALLVDAGLVPGSARALPGAPPDDQNGALTHLPRLLAHLRDADESRFVARQRELAFLANTLLAGCTVRGRAFTPQEASEAAAGVCNLGLDHWPGAAGAPPDGLLADHDLIAAFELGWSVLHRDVSLHVAHALIASLGALAGFDADIGRDLAEFRRALVCHVASGTPWLAHAKSDALAVIDPVAWVAVSGVLSECPVVCDALTAIVERWTRSVSPAAFRFISTKAHIEAVRRFARMLPGLLAA